ncbi:glycosyltransferase family 2 protein [Spelaeicoccus albus]|uniref:GT2 family glycosyltransferase n=1 Tax=Spelaeicoccus albus TaxID=1280376 RepID=A0A7Z0D322_9MICO|nr:glycosyltransferase family 2 protein [Spelaeicoccus albus]NYI67945.1 GT2 family glycosyltransferase [Spelaeicoccus albus]
MSPRITAVIVASDGAAYLPRTLDGLRAQSRPIDTLIGVDAGSTDESRQLLDGAADVVVDVPAGSGFGRAVRAGLDGAGLDGADKPDADDAPDDWLWLIHDDSAPDYTALEELLAELDISPSVAIAGCKQLDFDETDRLHDVGLTASAMGRRMTRLSRDEYDQGQYDARRDTLAVNSAGMLIRRDVWDALGGFDPAFRLFHDDIDLCRRARLAGHRVIVVPGAVMYHAEATRSGRRAAAVLPHGRAHDLRRGEVYSRLVNAAALAVPFHVIGALIAAVGRAVFKIAANDPGDAGREITSVVSAVSHPVRLVRSRRRAGRTRTTSKSAVAGLLATRRDVWQDLRDDWSGTAVPVEGAEPKRLESAAGAEADPADTEEAVEDFSPLDTLGAPRRRVWSHPVLLVMAVLIVVGILASYRLIGSGDLMGGALKPAPHKFAELVSSALSTWTGAGAGWPGAADPFQSALAILSLLAVGHVSVFIPVLLIAAIPLAGLGAWVAAGSVTGSRAVRAWTALVWAALPSLTEAIGGGRLGAVLAHVLLPWVALGIVRATGSARARRLNGRPGRAGVPSFAAAAAGGLALAGVAAGAPSLLPALIVTVIAVVCVTPSGRRRALVWLVLPVLALFGPFLVDLVKNPRLLAADPGVALAAVPAPPWQQLLMQPVDVGRWPMLHTLGSPVLTAIGDIAPIFLFAPIIIVAICALFIAGGNARGIRVAWGASALGLATALAGSHIVVGIGAHGLVSGWPGAGISLVAAGFLAAGAAGSHGLVALRTNPAIKTSIVVVAVLATVGPLLSLGAWTARSAAGTEPSAVVKRNADLRLPAVATDQGVGPDRTRTLLLTQPDGQLTGTLVRGAGMDLTDDSATREVAAVTGEPGREHATERDAAQTEQARAVAAVAAGSGGDPRPVLSTLGVGFIVLADRQVDAEGDTVHAPDTVLTGKALAREQEFHAAHDRIAAAIDTDAGLTRVGQTDAGELWRVDSVGAQKSRAPDRPARVHIVDPDGTEQAVVPSKAIAVSASVPAGKDGRRVVLSERYDENWTATLDGKQLAAHKDGWRQSFDLPSRGGDLKIRHAIPLQWLWRVGQGIVLILAVLVAIPLPGRRRERVSPRGRRTASAQEGRQS